MTKKSKYDKDATLSRGGLPKKARTKVAGASNEVTMKNIEKKELLVQLRARGVPYSKIEKELHVTKNTLIKWARELREDIETQQAKEIEHLREVYWAEKLRRFDLLIERLNRLHEEERRRDLKDIQTAKIIGLELQASDELKKEFRSLPIQISHTAFGTSLKGPEIADDETATPTGLDDEAPITGPFAAFAKGDINEIVRAILDEQTVLKDALFQIVNDSASESVKVAAIKSIDSISGRMLALLQSTGVIITASNERQIDEVLAGWAARDSRELMYECLQTNPGIDHLSSEAFRAMHEGDRETAEKLFSEFDDRVEEWKRKKVREEILEVKSALANETELNVRRQTSGTKQLIHSSFSD
jgi:hypothetical protein